MYSPEWNTIILHAPTFWHKREGVRLFVEQTIRQNNRGKGQFLQAKLQDNLTDAIFHFESSKEYYEVKPQLCGVPKFLLHTNLSLQLYSVHS